MAVYSATASGTATPLRTFQLTIGAIISVDGVGNLYSAGTNGIGGDYFIAVYPPTVTGNATPTRTINFGSSHVTGVAVDLAGDVFANVCVNNNTNCFIEEFAPGANGAATPINTINLPVESTSWVIRGGPVRLDGAGNIFTSLLLGDAHAPPGPMYCVVYGFGPTATGSTAPTVQITPTEADCTVFAVN